MTALIRRTALPDASPGSVDRAMRLLGLSGVRRDKGSGPRSRPRTASVPATCSTATSPPPPRTGPGSPTSPTCRTWAGFVYVAFIVDVFAQRIVAWHAATTKDADLVMIPLRMALWQRDREGHPVDAGQLIHHSDAGSPIHLDPAHRAPRPRGIAALDRVGRRRLRQRPDGVRSTASTRPSASAPPSSTTAPTRPSPTSSTPPPAGSTGTTTARLHCSLGMITQSSSRQAHYAALNREPQPVDCDWRIEDEFSPEGRLSLYTGTLPRHRDRHNAEPAHTRSG